MIVVAGLSGSGFEAVLNSFDTVGLKYLSPKMFEGYDKMLTQATPSVLAYEKYLGKFTRPDIREKLLEDIGAILPDGSWPVTDVNALQLKQVLKMGIPMGSAARVGYSFMDAEPSDVEAVYLITVSPDTVMLRRQSLRLACRTLEAKYANDRMYRTVSGAEFAEWNISPADLGKEYLSFKRMASDYLLKFSDKVQFVDGNGTSLKFKYGAVEKTVDNRQCFAEVADKHKLVPLQADQVITSNPNYIDPAVIYTEILALANGSLKPEPVAGSYSASVWYCARIQSMVTQAQCQECIKTLGESMIAKAKVNWDGEPCAVEVAYGPAPRKSIEESIRNNSWSVLP